jgi:hypothetical protein
MTSRRLLVPALLLAALLALSPAASARTLTIAKAKAAAKKFLAEDAKFYPYEPAKHVTTCERKSARTVDCGYKAVNDNGTADCGAVRVRLKTRKSKRPTVHFRGGGYMCAP